MQHAVYNKFTETILEQNTVMGKRSTSSGHRSPSQDFLAHRSHVFQGFKVAPRGRLIAADSIHFLLCCRKYLWMCDSGQDEGRQGGGGSVRSCFEPTQYQP